MVDLRAPCPFCRNPCALHATLDGVAYFDCSDCDFIFADPTLLARIDAGEPVREYDDAYWQMELAAARDRSWGPSLARTAEALLYCTIPVRRFVDVGAGPGFLLDALATYLPSHVDTFHGIEKFPPPQHLRTQRPNYIHADIADVDGTFECGTCIEVLEHLTPTMARTLARALRARSVPGSLFLFNTGLTAYVRGEDPGYLDPFGRGHITCWSVSSARRVFGPEGFLVHALPGKTWAFVIEMGPVADKNAMVDRIWHGPAANRNLLSDPVMGNVMYLLGVESARAYGVAPVERLPWQARLWKRLRGLAP